MANEKVDWTAWMREASAMMMTRSRELMERRGLRGMEYTWDLDHAMFLCGGTRLTLCVVGTVEKGTFMWAWANGAIPATAKVGLERVREFGLVQDIPALCEPCVAGGLAAGKSMLAVAGRVLDAASVWIDAIDQGHILFVLHEPALVPT
jgi:hypothetical protein